MNEDSTAFNDVPNTAKGGAYNGACWKVVRNKRRARNAAALEAAAPLQTDSENPQAKPRPSATQRLPPLPFRDEKTSPSPYKKALFGKPGNYYRYHGALATTAFGDQQSQGRISGGKLGAASHDSSIAPNFQLKARSAPIYPCIPISDPFPEIGKLRRDIEARYTQMHAKLESAIERTNARIQAAIESARQESLALRQEIIAVIRHQRSACTPSLLS
ncbi:hypothetical protein HPB51_023576 [Rhipicephalus microplus]|uniref:Uncharacterized protein n=1 Tax=Rhipicephalus microplus TaxID=6941 RepID=A0A9J6DDK0_RHIMP|nr:hypothetical protein HPB51_023576 [Rhipicephalus microplus]